MDKLFLFWSDRTNFLKLVLYILNLFNFLNLHMNAISTWWKDWRYQSNIPNSFNNSPNVLVERKASIFPIARKVSLSISVISSSNSGAISDITALSTLDTSSSLNRPVTWNCEQWEKLIKNKKKMGKWKVEALVYNYQINCRSTVSIEPYRVRNVEDLNFMEHPVILTSSSLRESFNFIFLTLKCSPFTMKLISVSKLKSFADRLKIEHIKYAYS